MGKEWNISYAEADMHGNARDERFTVLPSFWKALWWFIRKGRRYDYFYIWTTCRKER